MKTAKEIIKALVVAEEAVAAEEGGYGYSQSEKAARIYRAKAEAVAEAIAFLEDSNNNVPDRVCPCGAPLFWEQLLCHTCGMQF